MSKALTNNLQSKKRHKMELSANEKLRRIRDSRFIHQLSEVENEYFFGQKEFPRKGLPINRLFISTSQEKRDNWPHVTKYEFGLLQQEATLADKVIAKEMKIRPKKAFEEGKGVVEAEGGLFGCFGGSPQVIGSASLEMSVHSCCVRVGKDEEHEVLQEVSGKPKAESDEDMDLRKTFCTFQEIDGGDIERDKLYN